jgi:hypothetical protein
MLLAWSPGVPKQGQVFSAVVDGKPLSIYKVDGTEKMGNGQAGSSGLGSITLYSSSDASHAAKRSMSLPARTLTIRDAIPSETVVFPFTDLAQTEFQALWSCFDGTIARIDRR